MFRDFRCAAVFCTYYLFRLIGLGYSSPLLYWTLHVFTVSLFCLAPQVMFAVCPRERFYRRRNFLPLNFHSFEVHIPLSLTWLYHCSSSFRFSFYGMSGAKQKRIWTRIQLFVFESEWHSNTCSCLRNSNVSNWTTRIYISTSRISNHLFVFETKTLSNTYLFVLESAKVWITTTLIRKSPSFEYSIVLESAGVLTKTSVLEISGVSNKNTRRTNVAAD